MNTKAVFNEKCVDFFQVAWGQTKVLIGKGAPAFSENVMMKITEYLPGFIHNNHVHPEQEEIIFVISGKGITSGIEGNQEIGPGDVVRIPAGMKHATSNPNEETLRVVIIKTPPDK